MDFDHIDCLLPDQAAEPEDLARVPGDQGDQTLLVARGAGPEQGELDDGHAGRPEPLGGVAGLVGQDHGEPGPAGTGQHPVQLHGLIVRAPEGGAVHDGQNVELVVRRRPTGRRPGLVNGHATTRADPPAVLQ